MLTMFIQMKDIFVNIGCVIGRTDGWQKVRDNMTESGAIEKLRAYHKCQSLQVKGIYEDCNEKLCDNCDLCYAQGNVGEHIKSIEIAIQALEKQIPKKPIKSENQVVRYVNTYYCPTCELGITGTNIAKWCYHCGQKLDWSDEE